VVQGTVVDERGVALPDAVVTVEWQGNYATAGRQLSWQSQGLSTITARDGTYAVCGVPERQSLTVTAQFGGRKTPKASTRIVEGAHAVRIELRVAGVRAPTPTSK
jgi:hypothetical protein